MAITIVTQPSSNIPAQPEVLWKVTSTNVAQQNFKFIADVYKGGSLLMRIKRSPALDSAGYFDIGQIAFDQFKSNPEYLFDLLGTNVSWTNGNGHNYFTIKFGEEYGATPVVYPDLTISADKVIFWGDLYYKNFVGYSAPSYLFTNPAATNWQHLTNAPTTLSIAPDQSQYLSIIRDRGTINRFEVNTYYADNTLEGSHLISFGNDGGTFPITHPYWLLTFKMGTADLNNIHSNFFITTPSSNVITNDTAYYTIQIQNTAFADVGQIRRFNIDRNCTKDFTDIAFVNAFGVYEVYRFKGISTPETTFTNYQWRGKRDYNDLTPAYGDIFDQKSRVIQKENFEVSSGWVNHDEAEWLKDLIGSRQAFANVGGQPIAIVIQNDGYNAMTRNNRKMYEFKLKYRYSY